MIVELGDAQMGGTSCINLDTFYKNLYNEACIICQK